MLLGVGGRRGRRFVCQMRPRCPTSPSVNYPRRSEKGKERSSEGEVFLLRFPLRQSRPSSASLLSLPERVHARTFSAFSWLSQLSPSAAQKCNPAGQDSHTHSVKLLAVWFTRATVKSALKFLLEIAQPTWPQSRLHLPTFATDSKRSSS